jgi:hypothetical protein
VVRDRRIQIRPVPVEFEPGEGIVDGRCGVDVTGTVVNVRGTSVYYTDGCSACRSGQAHRTQSTFATTSKAVTA